MGRALNAPIAIAAVCATFAVGAIGTATLAAAQGELNLYSSRHYDTDERLYSNFEKATGIKINRIEAKADALIKRIESEGANSPADILLTVDAARLHRADAAGLLAPVESEALSKRIPEYLRHPSGHWFGFSTRARVIFYHKDRVSEPPKTYAELADPKYKGKVCVRSAGNIYQISMLASIIEHEGTEAAKKWAAGLKENLARDPEGGDTDQLRGIVSGECDIALGNTYYFARALRKDVRGVSSDAEKIGVVFPNQDSRGTHVNISGGALVKTAPNRENAIRFLEYLASDEAQNYFAAGNDEYPVVDGIAKSASVVKLGEFKADSVNLASYGENMAEAQKVWNEVAFK